MFFESFIAHRSYFGCHFGRENGCKSAIKGVSGALWVKIRKTLAFWTFGNSLGRVLARAPAPFSRIRLNPTWYKNRYEKAPKIEVGSSTKVIKTGSENMSVSQACFCWKMVSSGSPKGTQMGPKKTPTSLILKLFFETRSRGRLRGDIERISGGFGSFFWG